MEKKNNACKRNIIMFESRHRLRDLMCLRLGLLYDPMKVNARLDSNKLKCMAEDQNYMNLSV